MVCGRDFMGFHTRFRDVARGGIRLVLSRDGAAYERNFATLFDECYNLAYTQQNKNKDIPEGLLHTTFATLRTHMMHVGKSLLWAGSSG